MTKSKFFNGQVIAVVCCAAIYVFGATQHAALNFDDLALLPYFIDHTRGYGFVATVADVFVGRDLPHEYRTYSLSRVIQLVLSLVFGERPAAYFAVMALTWAIGARLVYLIVERACRDAGSALGASIIWLFSPFSICRTFHHFSYIILPGVLLLGYIAAIQSNRKLLALTLLFAIPLTGEATIPAAIAAAFICNFRRPGLVTLHCLAVIATTAAHFVLLRYINGYEGPQRFSSYLAVPLWQKLSALLQSIWSTIARSFQLSVIDFEPYEWGSTVYGFGWQHLNLTFSFVALTLSTLFVFITIKSQPATKTDARFVSLTGLLVLSLWVLFPIMLVSTNLYGHIFSLQIRSGYVVLPATFILLFLIFRNGDNRLRMASNLIPLLMIVGWSVNTMVVLPLQNEVDQSIEDKIAQIEKDGGLAVFVPQLQPGRVRPHSFLSPFLISTSTPFQQDWTTSTYLARRHHILFATTAAQIPDKNDKIRLTGLSGEIKIVDRERVFVASPADHDFLHPTRPTVPLFSRY